MSVTAYDPADPQQAAFISAIVGGENAGGNPWLGTGGTDLSRAATGAYGFPQWGGISTSAGPSHAAGLGQFQPGTWSRIASAFGLNFSNPSDQRAGIWYLAQQDYSARAGGGLTDALASSPSGVAATLAPTWTSLRGSGADAFASRYSAALGGAPNTPGASTPAGVPGASKIGALIGSLASRVGLGVVGLLFMVGAFWLLASRTQIVQRS